MSLGQILQLFANRDITDVVVNAPEDVRVLGPVGWENVAVSLGTAEQIAELAMNLIAKGNRHLDQANPLADVSLGLGQLPQLESVGLERLRVHAVLAGAVSANTLLSFRAHRHSGLPRLEQLVSQLGGRDDQLTHLESIAGSGESFLVSGSPGAGKTTLLRSMLAEVSGVRTLVLEDTAELLPIPGHFIGLQVRQANVEQRGEIALDRLLRESLRMNPQRIVIGEVRGGEARLLIQAMNLTGAGGACTIHARNSSTVADRLAEITGSTKAIDHFDWLIHLGLRDGRRRIDAIERIGGERGRQLSLAVG